MAVLEFIVGDTLQRPEIDDPTRTLLEYLREDLGRCGTKEGCAEGDCGACTVVVGTPRDGRMNYLPVNACIAFLPTLHGRHVLTVEDLVATDGALHAVQQAMVDAHGSQCGFCTPGFVMSLYAFARGGGGDRAAVLDALAGNLCRCTGYGPIVDAGLAVARAPVDDRWSAAGDDLLARLTTIRERGSLAVTSADGRAFYAPRSLRELLDLLASHPGAIPLAGGTDIGLWVTKRQQRLDTLVYTGEVAELSVMRVAGDTMEIGAAVTYADAFSTLAEHYPGFGLLLNRLGSVQIRATGTLGGNIANGSPIGDTPPPLIALGATVTLASRGGQRELPLEDFFIAYGQQDRAPDEIVTGIRVPLLHADQRFGVYKLAKRYDQDISSVCGAFNITVHDGKVADARIAFGGMAGTPLRATRAEQALLGRALNVETVDQAAEILAGEFSPLSDLRASAAYRRSAAANLLRRFCLGINNPEVATEVFEHA